MVVRRSSFGGENIEGKVTVKEPAQGLTSYRFSASQYTFALHAMESIVQSIGALVNTTLSSATYTEASSFGSALKANSMPNDLYAGHDWDSLNYPEQLWARWYM